MWYNRFYYTYDSYSYHHEPHIVNIAKTQRRAILNEIWFKSYCAKIDIGES